MFALAVMFAITACADPRPGAPSVNEPFQQWCREVFIADSGYVNSAQECRLVRLICDADTTVFTAPYCEFFRSDTLPCATPAIPDSTGKYYRQLLPDGTIRWVLCIELALYWEIPYVFEIRQEGSHFTLAGWDVFPHGNYACCWRKPMSGFYKVGPYLLIETCGTGTAFCMGAANVLFFPLAGGNDSIPETSIPVYMYDGTRGYDENLTSHQQIFGDTLVVNYSFERTSDEESLQSCDGCPKQYRFRAVFKIDDQSRKVGLLNREMVRQYEELKWMFE